MFKAAFYETDITPYLYDCAPGYFEARYCTDVLDRLHAHAVAMEMDGTGCILISLDCICIERRDVEEIRRRVFFATGIENVSVSAIHNHTGGPVTTLYAAPRNDRYCEQLCVRAADAAILAWQRLEPAKFGFAAAPVEGIAFNRRYLFRDGHVDMNPGENNPEVVRGTDIIDPEFIVARIDRADGSPMGFLASYALHLDCIGGLAFSADYPAVIREDLHRAFGEDIGFAWFTGCCGNVNHFDVTGKVHHTHTQIGHILSSALLELSEKLETAEPDSLKITRRSVRATIERPTQKMVDAAPNEVRRREVQAAMALPGGTLDCEVFCVGIGDFAFAALPGEVFCRFGLDIKARSPFACTMTAELSNMSTGYIKTRAAADEGGYEATPSTYNILDREAGYLMTDAAVENLLEMKR